MGLDDFAGLLPPEPGGDAAAQAGKPAVMVVDDDASVLSALQDILEDRWCVRCYLSADEAVAALSEEVRAVVLDVKMKGHDGFWACDEIRKINPHLPVIFHSAYQDAKDPFDIINEHQPFGYVTKGTPTKVLLDLIERAVRYSKLIVDGKRMLVELQQLQATIRVLKQQT